MTWQRSTAPTVKQFPSKFIPPMMDAIAASIKAANTRSDDVPPPIPEEARQNVTNEEIERLGQRLNRTFTRGGFSRNSSGRRRGGFRRQVTAPRIMSAHYAGVCAETDRRFEAGSEILWVPETRSCYVRDSETFQEFLESQREAQNG